MSTTPLFDQREPFDRQGLAASLVRLAQRNVFIGTSSWKYEGWLGQIYTRELYLRRGAFSQRLFQDECLREYAQTFPVVCGDFSFYQFPSEVYWRRLFSSAPESLQFVFKVPEQITAKMFPSHPRYGARGGLPNPSYLDPALFHDSFLRPLEPYRQRVAALILEFGTFSNKSYSNQDEFLGDLDRFLSQLPADFHCSVEIRNPEYLGPEYFHCLRSHGVAHVFNAWTRMPELAVQLRIPDVFTAGFSVCRALLRRGRSYEDAVKLFSPYDQIKDPNPDGRRALRSLIDHALDNRQAAFVFVNNRFEGSAPLTIQSVVGVAGC
jgi:uncharacterized protein YecE (DUF72 family)